MTNFTLRQIEVFLSCCRNDSFRRAADALDLSEASISQHISKLEEFTEFQLFNRSRGSVPHLTNNGKLFRKIATDFLNSVDSIRADTRAPKDQGAELIMYVSPMLLEYQVRPALPGFIRQTPNVNFRFSKPRPRIEVLADLKARRLDGALMSVQNERDFPGSTLISRSSYGLYVNEDLYRRWQENQKRAAFPTLMCDTNLVSQEDQLRLLRTLGLFKPAFTASFQFADEAVAMAIQGAGALPALCNIIERYDTGGQLIAINISDKMENRLFLQNDIDQQTKSIASSFFCSVESN